MLTLAQTLRSRYVKVVRPFLLAWFFGVFLSGGGFVAISNILLQFSQSILVLVVGEFGITLVLTAIGAMIAEEVLYHMGRRIVRASQPPPVGQANSLLR